MYPKAFIQNLVQIGAVVSEKIQFEFLYVHDLGPRSRNDPEFPRSGKKVWKMNFFQVKEKSGNFNFSQGNLEKSGKSQGNLRIFKKVNC